jgi:hypothetical protein
VLIHGIKSLRFDLLKLIFSTCLSVFFYVFNWVATLCEPHMHDRNRVLVCAFFLAHLSIGIG